MLSRWEGLNTIQELVLRAACVFLYASVMCLKVLCRLSIVCVCSCQCAFSCVCLFMTVSTYAVLCFLAVCCALVCRTVISRSVLDALLVSSDRQTKQWSMMLRVEEERHMHTNTYFMHAHTHTQSEAFPENTSSEAISSSR